MRKAARSVGYYFLRIPIPSNFFWKRETRPPRSRICWLPPVQAGCDFGSMSRFSLSPALPQVERVWKAEGFPPDEKTETYRVKALQRIRRNSK